MSKWLKTTGIVCASSLLFGCANFTTGNLFSHYSVQTQNSYQALSSGLYQQALEIRPEYAAGEILDNLEKGRLSYLAEDYQASLDYLDRSSMAVRRQQDRATLSISEVATSVGVLALNDNLNEYYPADYELGFLHLYSSLNYLKSNDLSSALVEVRKANQVQEQAKKTRESELDQRERQLSEQGVQANLGELLASLPSVGDKLSSVQNGYLFFLSGLLYETDGDLNSAYVDYRRALAVAGDNQSVIQSTLRVARRLGMSEDVKLLQSEYGDVPTRSTEQGQVIVIEEQGVVSSLSSAEFALPVTRSNGDFTWYNIALPVYPSAAGIQYSSPKISENSIKLDQLANIENMARYHLLEQMPSMVFRQLLRIIAKEQLRRGATEEAEDVGNLILNVWNTLTEQPDTRSWQSLPSVVASGSKWLSPGMHTLSISEQTYQFEVKQGGTTLVWISRQGQSAKIWHKQLGRL